MVLMIDTSASMEEKLPTAQTAAIRFTKTLRPQDLAQVVQFNDRATTLQAFTNDLAAARGGDPQDRGLGADRAPQRALHRPQGPTSEKKAAELRRRAIVLLSDGEDTASLVTDEQVLELAQKSEINIYAISLRTNRASDRQRQAFSQAEYLLNALDPRDRRPRLLPDARSGSSTPSTTGSPRSCARSTASATSRRTPAATASGGGSSSGCPTREGLRSATSSATTRRAG